jgi:hypothetical protein
MAMYILIIGSILLGAILGRFFGVLVLILACAVTLAMVVASSAYFEHSLLRALLEVVVLLTSLQIGYVSGLLSHLIPSRSPGDHGRARALSWSKDPAQRAKLPGAIAKAERHAGHSREASTPRSCG